MKQKLALCCALIAEPQVLLLDEPTTGVDTIARREFWDILAGLTAQNITVLVATPDLDEAERCDRVTLIYNGQIQQMGSPTELKGNLGLNRLIIRTSQLIQAEKALIVTGEIAEVSTLGDACGGLRLRIEVLVKDVNRSYIERLYATNLFVPAQWKGDRFPDAIDRGSAHVQVTIPPDFASEVQAGRTGNLQVVIDGSDVINARVTRLAIQGTYPSKQLASY